MYIHSLPKFWTQISNRALLFQKRLKKNVKSLIISGDLTFSVFFLTSFIAFESNYHLLSKILRFFLVVFVIIRRDLNFGSKILVNYVFT